MVSAAVLVVMVGVAVVTIAIGAGLFVGWLVA